MIPLLAIVQTEQVKHTFRYEAAADVKTVNLAGTFNG